MFISHKRMFLFAALFALAGCPKTSPDPPPPKPDPVDPDASTYPAPGSSAVAEEVEGSPAALSSPCGRACDHLKAIGCPEAMPKDSGAGSCYRGCVAQAAHERVPTGCWTGAADRKAARSCGLLRCPD